MTICACGAFPQRGAKGTRLDARQVPFQGSQDSVDINKLDEHAVESHFHEMPLISFTVANIEISAEVPKRSLSLVLPEHLRKLAQVVTDVTIHIRDHHDVEKCSQLEKLLQAVLSSEITNFVPAHHQGLMQNRQPDRMRVAADAA